MQNEASDLECALELFPSEERAKRNQLCSLMSDWKRDVASKAPILFYDDGEEHDAVEYFGIDGFMPNYYCQQQKILFIGREARDNAKQDTVIKLIDEFSKNTYIYKSVFWRRILHILYGIKKCGKVKYHDVPHISDIVSQMAKSNDYGFAFMNISKYSNDRKDGGRADFQLINRFLDDVFSGKRNFIREEIRLLDPDVVITANLWNGSINAQYLDDIFPGMSLVSSIEDKADYYQFMLEGKSIKLIDLWHFSSPCSDEDCFYNPVMSLLFSS